MTRSEKKKRYDGMLIFVVLLLVAAGLVILYSTSAYNGQVKFHRAMRCFYRRRVQAGGCLKIMKNVEINSKNL